MKKNINPFVQFVYVKTTTIEIKEALISKSKTFLIQVLVSEFILQTYSSLRSICSEKSPSGSVVSLLSYRALEN